MKYTAGAFCKLFAVLAATCQLHVSCDSDNGVRKHEFQHRHHDDYVIANARPIEVGTVLTEVHGKTRNAKFLSFKQAPLAIRISETLKLSADAPGSFGGKPSSSGDKPSSSGSLSNFCGGNQNKHEFRKDDPIEVQWGKYRLWYSGVVTNSNADGTYGVKFEDGRVKPEVDATKLRKQKSFKVDDEVEVRWQGLSQWYHATIQTANTDGTYEVVFRDDGAVEKDVPLKHIRQLKSKASSSDSACEVSDAVDKVQKSIDSTDVEVKNFMMRQTGDGMRDAVKKLGPPANSDPGELEAKQKAREKALEAGQFKLAQAAAARQDHLAGLSPGPAPGPGVAPEENAPSLAPAPVAALPTEWIEMIQSLRQEILERTQELVRRSQALGAFSWQLEELNDLKSLDEARLTHPLPLTPEEALAEIKRLEEINMDRARRLQNELQLESKLEEQPDLLKPTDHDAEKMVEFMQNQKKQVQGAMNEVIEKEEELDNRGDLDPELRYELDNTLKRVNTVVNDMEKSGAVDVPAATSIASVHNALTEAKESTNNLGRNIMPNGHKFWRYRWEYSFVEALLICLIYLLAAAWQMALDAVRAAFGAQLSRAPGFIEDYVPRIALATWVRFLRGELVVLLFVVMTLWVLSQVGFFGAWAHAQLVLFPSFNLPTAASKYVEMVFMLAMQLIVAVILFFMLTLQICYCAMQNERDCRLLEEGRRDELASYPVSLAMIGQFATSPEEYASLKQGWLKDVAERSTRLTPRGRRTPAQEVVSALDERRVFRDGNLNAFPLWLIIGQRVRIGVERTMKINAGVWLFCFMTFLGFAMLHGLLHVAYIRISIVLAAISISVYIYMAIVVGNIRSVDDDGWLVRIPPTVVVACFQFPLFFLCFVTTRLIVSMWMWVYFFWTALLFSFLLAAFMAIFPLLIAPLVITYLTKTCFPPHTDSLASLIREVMEEHEVEKVREDLRRRTPRAYSPMPRFREASSQAVI